LFFWGKRGRSRKNSLEKSPNILEFNLLEINLVLVVKILSLELNGAHINECVFRLSLLLCFGVIRQLSQPNSPF